MGRLIPAGTGLSRYRNLRIQSGGGEQEATQAVQTDDTVEEVIEAA